MDHDSSGYVRVGNSILSCSASDVIYSLRPKFLPHAVHTLWNEFNSDMNDATHHFDTLSPIFFDAELIICIVFLEKVSCR
jgi:hypothetical protein